ncbi:hypothetical protein G9H61_05115 [Aquirufa ecclesiirivi]|uniref:Uncharacterized protein n=1 Tax=Aquirufa ecclesiirivi TaxID=2715124 RepID=A0ABT4JEV8_9BACT|nr:hypothetical protein [Aquirufa ecclesiirivi]MCZ2474814.1 hypothetical protein [Aquirufa ecclesiirivi]
MKISKLNVFVYVCLVLVTHLTWAQNKAKQPVYQDTPFWQDYSVKYYLAKDQASELSSSYADRNGNIILFGSTGTLLPHDGQFLYPGTLVKDTKYRTSAPKKMAALTSYQKQFVLLDDKAVLSHAFAGSIYAKHELTNANRVVGGKDFSFLISDGNSIHLVKDSKTLFKGNLSGDQVLDMKYQASSQTYYILGKQGLYNFSPAQASIIKLMSGGPFTAFDVAENSTKIYVGGNDGYQIFDLSTKQVGEKQQKLPWTEITAIEVIGDKVWLGSTKGAFALKKDGKFDYYNGERWLPSNVVKHIAEGPKNSVLITTTAGLGQICFKKMTLHEKAVFYDDQVRKRHIRNGFNASLDGIQKGNLSTGYLADSDNDGLWTSMYLGGEIFRYAVTKDPEALQNCRESLDAMERLYKLTPVPGFPARSFERRGFIPSLSDPERWQPSPDPEWDFKSTTSSDEVIGHIFAFGAMAELVDGADLKKRSIVLIDTLMSHILKNDMYLIDFDGKPTMWGKWNPKYVNSFPTNVGDRKLNSSNITSMLQTAYHFTKKEKYKQKAFELLTKYGYYENLMRPFSVLGRAGKDADAHAQNMSDGWNHSDDEMYYVGYWGLYRYAFNDTLKANFKKSILDHWQMERPEKEGAWNIFTALTGTKQFDLNEAAWYLREHPMDMIDWAIQNSHRKDIVKVADNFRRQTTQEVLPPDEKPIMRHNANQFNMDRNGGNGLSEHSAGDIWLLPYWMGRYLGVISEPKK